MFSLIFFVFVWWPFITVTLGGSVVILVSDNPVLFLSWIMQKWFRFSEAADVRQFDNSLYAE